MTFPTHSRTRPHLHSCAHTPGALAHAHTCSDVHARVRVSTCICLYARLPTCARTCSRARARRHARPRTPTRGRMCIERPTSSHGQTPTRSRPHLHSHSAAARASAMGTARTPVLAIIGTQGHRRPCASNAARTGTGADTFPCTCQRRRVHARALVRTHEHARSLARAHAFTHRTARTSESVVTVAFASIPAPEPAPVHAPVPCPNPYAP